MEKIDIGVRWTARLMAAWWFVVVLSWSLSLSLSSLVVAAAHVEEETGTAAFDRYALPDPSPNSTTSTTTTSTMMLNNNDDIDDDDDDDDDVGRVFVLGDLHADLETTRATLRMLRLIDADDNDQWAPAPGKDYTVVFTGDLVDYGPDTKALFTFILGLERSARQAGSQVRACVRACVRASSSPPHSPLTHSPAHR